MVSYAIKHFHKSNWIIPILLTINIVSDRICFTCFSLIHLTLTRPIDWWWYHQHNSWTKIMLTDDQNFSIFIATWTPAQYSSTTVNVVCSLWQYNNNFPYPLESWNLTIIRISRSKVKWIGHRCILRKKSFESVFFITCCY